MKNEQVLSKDIVIKIATVNDAPLYSISTRMLKVTECTLIRDGTTQGNSTIDMNLVDAEGNKYLIMVTGRILSQLAHINELVNKET